MSQVWYKEWRHFKHQKQKQDKFFRLSVRQTLIEVNERGLPHSSVPESWSRTDICLSFCRLKGGREAFVVFNLSCVRLRDQSHLNIHVFTRDTDKYAASVSFSKKLHSSDGSSRFHFNTQFSVQLSPAGNSPTAFFVNFGAQKNWMMNLQQLF